MIYPTREEYKAWIQTRPEDFFTAKAVCSDCLKPMPEKEIILRAIATMDGQKAILGQSSDTKEAIIFTYVCGTSRMSEECIDALIYISAGFFDVEKWDFSREAIEAAITCITEGEKEDRWGKKLSCTDRLDWKAINTYQHLSKAYKRKRAFFFWGNESLSSIEPYRRKIKPEKKTKKAEWLK